MVCVCVCVCVNNQKIGLTVVNRCTIYMYMYSNSFLPSQRFYDEVFPSIGTPISDHYGVKVRLSNIREKCNYIQEYRYHCVSEIEELFPLQLDYSEVCF